MTPRRADGRMTETVLDFLACVLVVVTHFTNYVVHVGYDRVWPDLILAYGGLIGLALVVTGLLRIPSVWLRTIVFSLLLIVAFADAVFQFGTQGEGLRLGVGMIALGTAMLLAFVLRRHINKIVIVIFLTMLVSTVGAVGFAAHGGEGVGRDDAEVGRAGLPVVVHLVLDEHIGLAGMTDDLPGAHRIRTLLSDFYVRNGFRLFARAFSPSVNTRDTLGSLFNGGDATAGETFVARERDKYVMARNGYLDMWRERGYKRRVLQSSYLDFCRNADIPMGRCTTYLHDGYDVRGTSTMPLLDRVSLIAQMYASSISVVKLARLAERVMDDRLGKMGLGWDDRNLWTDRVGPLAVATPLDGLIDEIAEGRPGGMYFAHLLMPHYPYVYDASCRVRTPVSSWLMRADDAWRNTDEGRRERYGQYFQQIECTVTKLQTLIDAMKKRGIYDTATIVVHGDHGSRITRFKPEPQAVDRMNVSDFMDGFSTLFACKAAGVAPGIDDAMLPLSALLALCTGAEEPKSGAADAHARTVCLLGPDGSCRTADLPSFPERAQ